VIDVRGAQADRTEAVPGNVSEAAEVVEQVQPGAIWPPGEPVL
jgi:hypothetical protein